ncbi:MAG TPA: FAD-binding oxidoreductase [Ilumatobacteraceae bacterium]|nr:FAD-binding oxidoreductase [Ilumatobacteraceae bacterium]
MALDRSLPDRAEVVIIGGGVMGTSAAFHLAEAGVTDVLLLEADQLSCGSTSKSAGGVRLQFSDEINIALALRSMDAFERFAERPGADIGLRQVGYLFLLTDPNDVVLFEQNTALQNSMGVPSRMLSAAEAGRLSTLANVDDVLAASVCMRDGHATPDAVVLGYAAAARALGVEIVNRCPVIGIDVDGGEITGVRTATGTVSTSTVICVAGAWSPGIAAMVGVDLPVQPVARPIWFTEPMPNRPENLPMTIDFATGFYFHSEGPGLLFGMADTNQPPGFDAPMRPDWLEVVSDVVAHRAPALLEVGIAGGWHGYYETTPDHNALIGESATVSRFIYATGFSGHGFLLGPAVGEVLRDLILGHTPPVDVSGFDVERFAGETRPERNIV